MRSTLRPSAITATLGMLLLLLLQLLLAVHPTHALETQRWDDLAGTRNGAATLGLGGLPIVAALATEHPDGVQLYASEHTVVAVALQRAELKAVRRWSQRLVTSRDPGRIEMMRSLGPGAAVVFSTHAGFDAPGVPPAPGVRSFRATVLLVASGRIVSIGVAQGTKLLDFAVASSGTQLLSVADPPRGVLLVAGIDEAGPTTPIAQQAGATTTVEAARNESHVTALFFDGVRQQWASHSQSYARAPVVHVTTSALCSGAVAVLRQADGSGTLLTFNSSGGQWVEARRPVVDSAAVCSAQCHTHVALAAQALTEHAHYSPGHGALAASVFMPTAAAPRALRPMSGVCIVSTAPLPVEPNTYASTQLSAGQHVAVLDGATGAIVTLAGLPAWWLNARVLRETSPGATFVLLVRHDDGRGDAGSALVMIDAARGPRVVPHEPFGRLALQLLSTTPVPASATLLPDSTLLLVALGPAEAETGAVAAPPSAPALLCGVDLRSATLIPHTNANGTHTTRVVVDADVRYGVQLARVGPRWLLLARGDSEATASEPVGALADASTASWAVQRVDVRRGAGHTPAPAATLHGRQFSTGAVECFSYALDAAGDVTFVTADAGELASLRGEWTPAGDLDDVRFPTKLAVVTHTRLGETHALAAAVGAHGVCTLHQQLTVRGTPAAVFVAANKSLAAVFTAGSACAAVVVDASENAPVLRNSSLFGHDELSTSAEGTSSPTTTALPWHRLGATWRCNASAIDPFRPAAGEQLAVEGVPIADALAVVATWYDASSTTDERLAASLFTAVADAATLDSVHRSAGTLVGRRDMAAAVDPVNGWVAAPAVLVISTSRRSTALVWLPESLQRLAADVPGACSDVTTCMVPATRWDLRAPAPRRDPDWWLLVLTASSGGSTVVAFDGAAQRPPAAVSIVGTLELLVPREPTVRTRAVVAARRSGSSPVVQMLIAVGDASAALADTDPVPLTTANITQVTTLDGAATLIEASNGTHGAMAVRLSREPPPFTQWPPLERHELVAVFDPAKARWVLAVGRLAATWQDPTGAAWIIAATRLDDSSSDLAAVDVGTGAVAQARVPGRLDVGAAFFDVASRGAAVAAARGVVLAIRKLDATNVAVAFDTLRGELLGGNAALQTAVCGAPVSAVNTAGGFVVIFHDAARRCGGVATYSAATDTWNASSVAPGAVTTPPTFVHQTPLAAVAFIRADTDTGRGQLLVLRGGELADVRDTVAGPAAVEALATAPTDAVLVTVSQSDTTLCVFHGEDLAGPFCVDLVGAVDRRGDALVVSTAADADQYPSLTVATATTSARRALSAVALYDATARTWRARTVYGTVVVRQAAVAAAPRVMLWCATSGGTNRSCVTYDEAKSALVHLVGTLQTIVQLPGAGVGIVTSLVVETSVAVLEVAPTVTAIAVGRVFDGTYRTHAVATALAQWIVVGQTAGGECVATVVNLGAGTILAPLRVSASDSECLVSLASPLVMVRARTRGSNIEAMLLAALDPTGSDVSTLENTLIDVRPNEQLPAALTPFVPLGVAPNVTELAVSATWSRTGIGGPTSLLFLARSSILGKQALQCDMKHLTSTSTRDGVVVFECLSNVIEALRVSFQPGKLPEMRGRATSNLARRATALAALPDGTPLRVVYASTVVELTQVVHVPLVYNANAGVYDEVGVANASTACATAGSSGWALLAGIVSPKHPSGKPFVSVDAVVINGASLRAVAATAAHVGLVNGTCTNAAPAPDGLSSPFLRVNEQTVLLFVPDGTSSIGTTVASLRMAGSSSRVAAEGRIGGTAVLAQLSPVPGRTIVASLSNPSVISDLELFVIEAGDVAISSVHVEREVLLIKRRSFAALNALLILAVQPTLKRTVALTIDLVTGALRARVELAGELHSIHDVVPHSSSTIVVTTSERQSSSSEAWSAYAIDVKMASAQPRAKAERVATVSFGAKPTITLIPASSNAVGFSAVVVAFGSFPKPIVAALTSRVHSTFVVSELHDTHQVPTTLYPLPASRGSVPSSSAAKAALLESLTPQPGAAWPMPVFRTGFDAALLLSDGTWYRCDGRLISATTMAGNDALLVVHVQHFAKTNVTLFDARRGVFLDAVVTPGEPGGVVRFDPHLHDGMGPLYVVATVDQASTPIAGVCVVNVSGMAIAGLSTAEGSSIVLRAVRTSARVDDLADTTTIGGVTALVFWPPAFTVVLLRDSTAQPPDLRDVPFEVDRFAAARRASDLLPAAPALDARLYKVVLDFGTVLLAADTKAGLNSVLIPSLPAADVLQQSVQGVHFVGHDEAAWFVYDFDATRRWGYFNGTLLRSLPFGGNVGDADTPAVLRPPQPFAVLARKPREVVSYLSVFHGRRQTVQPVAAGATSALAAIDALPKPTLLLAGAGDRFSGAALIASVEPRDGTLLDMRTVLNVSTEPLLDRVGCLIEPYRYNRDGHVHPVAAGALRFCGFIDGPVRVPNGTRGDPAPFGVAPTPAYITQPLNTSTRLLVADDAEGRIVVVWNDLDGSFAASPPMPPTAEAPLPTQRNTVLAFATMLDGVGFVASYCGWRYDKHRDEQQLVLVAALYDGRDWTIAHTDVTAAAACSESVNATVSRPVLGGPNTSTPVLILQRHGATAIVGRTSSGVGHVEVFTGAVATIYNVLDADVTFLRGLWSSPIDRGIAHIVVLVSSSGGDTLIVPQLVSGALVNTSVLVAGRLERIVAALPTFAVIVTTEHVIVFHVNGDGSPVAISDPNGCIAPWRLVDASGSRTPDAVLDDDAGVVLGPRQLRFIVLQCASRDGSGVAVITAATGAVAIQAVAVSDTTVSVAYSYLLILGASAGLGQLSAFVVNATHEAWATTSAGGLSRWTPLVTPRGTVFGATARASLNDRMFVLDAVQGTFEVFVTDAGATPSIRGVQRASDAPATNDDVLVATRKSSRVLMLVGVAAHEGGRWLAAPVFTAGALAFMESPSPFSVAVGTDDRRELAVVATCSAVAARCTTVATPFGTHAPPRWTDASQLGVFAASNRTGTAIAVVNAVSAAVLSHVFVPHVASHVAAPPFTVDAAGIVLPLSNATHTVVVGVGCTGFAAVSPPVRAVLRTVRTATVLTVAGPALLFDHRLHRSAWRLLGAPNATCTVHRDDGAGVQTGLPSVTDVVCAGHRGSGAAIITVSDALLPPALNCSIGPQALPTTELFAAGGGPDAVAAAAAARCGAERVAVMTSAFGLTFWTEVEGVQTPLYVNTTQPVISNITLHAASTLSVAAVATFATIDALHQVSVSCASGTLIDNASVPLRPGVNASSAAVAHVRTSVPALVSQLGSTVVVWSLQTGRVAAQYTVTAEATLRLQQGFGSYGRAATIVADDRAVVLWAALTWTPTVPQPSRTLIPVRHSKTNSRTLSYVSKSRSGTHTTHSQQVGRLRITTLVRLLSLNITRSPTRSRSRSLGPEPTVVFTPRPTFRLLLEHEELPVLITATAASILSGLGAASSVMHGPRIVALAAAGYCDGPQDPDDGPLPFYLAPFPVSIGTSSVRHYLGSATVQTACAIGLFFLHFLAGIVVQRGAQMERLDEALAAVRHPWFSALMVLWLAPASLSNAVTVIAHTDVAGLRVQGIIMVVVWIALGGYFASAVLSARVRRETVFQPYPKDMTKCTARRVWGAGGEWLSRPDRRYLQRFGFLYGDMRRGRSAWFALDLVFSYGIAAVGGVLPHRGAQCDAIVYTHVVLFLLHFGALVAMTPFAGVGTLLTMTLASACCAAAAVLLLMAVTGSLSEGPRVGGYLLMVAVGFYAIKALADVLVAVYECIVGPTLQLEGAQKKSPPRGALQKGRRVGSAARPGASPEPAVAVATDAAGGSDSEELDLAQLPLLRMPVRSVSPTQPQHTGLLFHEADGPSRYSPPLPNDGDDYGLNTDAVVLASALSGFGPVARMFNPIEQDDGRLGGATPESPYHTRRSPSPHDPAHLL